MVNPGSSVDEIIAELKKQSSAEVKSKYEYFGIYNVNSFGLTTPQLRIIAKQIGKNHTLAIQLWKTGYHEARHIAAMIADPQKLTNQLMESWLKEFNSWDIVDGTCTSLFRKSENVLNKINEWSKRKKEFEKRAAFTLMAQLAVHNKKEKDFVFEQFLKIIGRESSDERNFVRKAVNWALRQIGKRNERLCKKAISTAGEILKKNDPSSKWIAQDALRELEKYKKEGKIKNVGSSN